MDKTISDAFLISDWKLHLLCSPAISGKPAACCQRRSYPMRIRYFILTNFVQFEIYVTEHFTATPLLKCNTASAAVQLHLCSNATPPVEQCNTSAAMQHPRCSSATLAPPSHLPIPVISRSSQLSIPRHVQPRLRYFTKKFTRIPHILQV